MTYRVVAISREFGSGGRTIGQKLAERLNVKCYDSELIQKIAQESGFSDDYVKQEDENKPSYWSTPFFTYNYAVASNQDVIWGAQEKVILDLARDEACVIVGRCAEYILRDDPRVLKVFIHADDEKRAQRIVNVYGEKSASPEKRIRDKDKQRKAYHAYYTEWEWGDAENYDICLDSARLGIDKCVNILADLYQY
ncbi:MAG: cytidylate kinase-like family protein [Anaerococcus sp.]|jgi:cytidylate kinase|nr:cytidylate kinase-like family protein [Peptoniphilaceae bacterium]MDY3055562.1 cytidylate kinase-like family protein [Anaerococcus sp.]